MPPPIEPVPAISVTDLSLSFGSKVVLDGVNLMATRGTIFGLLGPSGCGKTSLIRCLIGTLKCSSGAVTVLGHEPGSKNSSVPGASVGFMPQEITLYDDLTIDETLRYFAALLGMSELKIKSQIEFFLSFLHLSEPSRLVRNLSGGQKRRVSLATALIHKPPLLILDEPTVGVDPLLRQSIWAHLKQLSQQERTTVLITTHYIEEARDAHQIGLMRDGKMLAQNSPDALRQLHRQPSLEAVFLHLCYQAESESSGQGPQAVAVEEPVQEKPEGPSRRASTSSSSSSGVVSLHDEKGALRPSQPLEMPHEPTDCGLAHPISWRAQLGAMITKNVRTIRRNVILMLFQFMLPTIEVILFCACIGLNLHSIPVAVFDADNSVFSQSILGSLNSHLIKQSFFNSSEDAIGAVRDGVASVALTISSNFSACLFERIMSIEPDVAEDVVYNSTIHLHPDMSNQLMIYAVQKEVTAVFLHVGQHFLRVNGGNAALLKMPVMMEEPVYGLKDPIYRDYMAPGTILSIGFLSAIPLTAMVLVVERKHGLIERSMATGASYLRIMIALLIPQTFILFVSSMALMVFVFPIFGIPYHGEFFLIFLLTYLQSICGMCFGVLVSTLAKDENTATMIALGFFYPNLLLSGTVWPVEAMSPWAQSFAYYLPQTMPITSMRLIITRGWSLLQLEVLTGFAITGAWIVAFLLLSVLAFKVRKL